MNLRRRTVLAAALLFCAAIFAQAPAAPHVEAANTGYYTRTAPLDLSGIFPPPPAQNSDTNKAELALLHQIEQSRTPAQVAAAQDDDKHEDVFYLRSVMGEGFTRGNLPLLTALSDRMESEGSAAGLRDGYPTQLLPQRTFHCRLSRCVHPHTDCSGEEPGDSRARR